MTYYSPHEAVEYNRLNATPHVIEGYPDLAYDPATESSDKRILFANAVREFQLANGLAPDGKLGPSTLGAMQSKQPSNGVANFEFGMYCDFKALDDQAKAWLAKHKPDVAYLGMNDDGQTELRPSGWPGGIDQVKRDIDWLRSQDIEPGILAWYDFREKQNEGLEWVYDLVIEKGIENVDLDVEYWAKKTARAGEREIWLAQQFADNVLNLAFPGYGFPVGEIVDNLSRIIGAIRYTPMIYSNEGAKEGNGGELWAPGTAQKHYWPMAPSNSGPWLEAWGGSGLFDQASWPCGSKEAVRRQYQAYMDLGVDRIIGWSLKHIDNKDWVGELINELRWA